MRIFSTCNIFRVVAILLFFVSLPMFFSCQDDSSENENVTRPFRMGFTPWPYDASLEAVNWVYDSIYANGDIVSHHMEEGVPWQEAYQEFEFSEGFMNEIQSRVNRHVRGHKMVLSVSPLNMARNGLALNRGDNLNQPLSAPWDNYSFNSTEVKTAYLNYVKRMIGYFDPDYLIIGIEVNLLISNDNDEWDSYVELHQYVYSEIKKLHPQLPIGLSVFCVPFFPEWSPDDKLTEQLKGLKDIEPYIDFLAFSVHLFMSSLLADTIPEDYIKQLFSLTNKPVAISESSYPTQFWQTISEPVLNFNGSETKQEHFLSLVLKESANSDALFVIWYTLRDFDALWNGVLNRDPIALIWRDTGIYDELGNPRLSYYTWMNWYHQKYK